ncbi:MAG: hypothetical protein GY932_08970 [Arcobacter sp.]|nr:hypothetical protein [Arcobacter sp.]
MKTKMYITYDKILKYGLCSNAVYVFLLFLFDPNGINVQKIAITLFLMLSVIFVLFLAYVKRNWLKDIPKSSRTLFTFILIWGVIVMLRGISFKLQDLVTNFGNVYMGLAWLVPITLIIGLDIKNWKTVFKFIWFIFFLMILAMPFFPAHAALSGKLKTEWSWLLRPINFIIIFGIYKFKLINRLLIYLTFLIYFLVTFEAEQRIEYVFFGLSVFFLFIIKIKHFNLRKDLLKLIIIGFVILIISVFTIGYENLSALASKIINYTDSRTFLFTELFQDFNIFEEIFGRGSLGTYYSPLFAKQTYYFEHTGEYRYTLDHPIRITIEVGYLQMILKGGFVLLISTISLKLQAVYLALFKSKNNYVKRLGIFVLVLTIISLISFRPAFTPTFILLWISIGTVLSRRNRLMTDKEIEKILDLK